jgi:hypothetical protein
MFSALLGRLKDDIGAVKAILLVHDTLRALVAVAPPAGATDPLAQLRLNAPQVGGWKIYDHSAAFTRLYAIYERFVFDLITAWLDMLPQHYPAYSDLPDSVKSGHRIGVAEILSKYGGDRYRHLTEEQTIRGLYEGISGARSFSLLPEAFLIDDQNLRPGTLEKLFKKVGIDDCLGWICNHGVVDKFIQDVRANASTVESELKNFILYRNAAAHGDVSEIASLEEINKSADFIMYVCEALAELVASNVIDRLLVTNKADKVGTVVRTLSNEIVAVAFEQITITIGDEFYIVREVACYSVRVESLGYKNVNDYRWLHAGNREPIAMKLNRPAKTGSDVVRLHAADAEPLTTLPLRMLPSPSG